jgi:hypothetical protein
MMYRTLGAVALLTMAIAAPMQDVAAQDPVGGAILGGAAGAILGGALDGGRGAAIGAGATGAAIAAQGRDRRLRRSRTRVAVSDRPPVPLVARFAPLPNGIRSRRFNPRGSQFPQDPVGRLSAG